MNAWPDPLRLIEAHGRLGLFKCINDDACNGGDTDDSAEKDQDGDKSGNSGRKGDGGGGEEEEEEEEEAEGEGSAQVF